MKRQIFWPVFFTVFLRLQFSEAIAVIFWQSASYVVFFFEATNFHKDSDFCRLSPLGIN